MELPITKDDFQHFIDEVRIFEKTRARMLVCLRRWFEDDVQNFTEDMRADLDAVLTTYHFKNAGVSISKSYRYDPPLDYVSCTISIDDAEGDICANYTAYFDCNLNCFDDKLTCD